MKKSNTLSYSNPSESIEYLGVCSLPYRNRFSILNQIVNRVSNINVIESKSIDTMEEARLKTIYKKLAKRPDFSRIRFD